MFSLALSDELELLSTLALKHFSKVRPKSSGLGKEKLA
jgi:hypothetical protein